MKRFAAANEFVIHVNEPTRITPTSATILDQFLSNMSDLVESCVVTAPVSTNDHCTVGLNLQFKIEKTTAYKRLIWNYGQADFVGFRQALANFDWETCFTFENINDICNAWTSSFISIAREFIPNKVVTVRPWDMPWYSNDFKKTE